MNKEDVLTWLTQLGTGWVGIIQVYKVYDSEIVDFWDNLTDWHDGAYITKRFNDYSYEKVYPKATDRGVEEYKLTKKAIRSLEAE